MTDKRNISALNQIANALESGQAAKELGVGFNMRWISNEGGRDVFPAPDLSGHACGTVACIAGTAVKMFDLPKDIYSAGSFLGLSGGERRRLFMPSGWNSNNTGGGFTAKQAASVVRHFACTDEINWDLFDLEGKRRNK